ncbi:unnamed protein product [Zymoseptoria tritici ST99CH_3D1]|uniref:DBF4-type domain-containing protein n=2 Tax=Zymoseptoria tritici TaxID=1047171 RepID=A0A1X7RRH7_ZYMT9|nr:unnamed protein product [Zymoseptoria tritici ST99CH_3D7]SMR50775.1 unnamed protein product [Zymoseptoria tritici ST99CH_1E4]SMR51716.1 unnamed protein product [Zymoseptoria tritici ST99CH_3D1]
MASRRQPLANVPNAINSPFHTLATAGSNKRTRAQAGDQREAHGQPPNKKQVVESYDEGDENTDPRRRSGVAVVLQDKPEEPFGKRLARSQPTAFEKKLAAVREKKLTSAERAHKQDNLESIRQWQRHYKRQFPSFVFYFDSVSDDVRQKSMRNISYLGAREEKFFSKAVTHVITTRTIPAESAHTSPDDEVKLETTQSRTSQSTSLTQDQRRTTSVLDTFVQRRGQSVAPVPHPSGDVRRTQPHSVDILTKARSLGIKIWALEKLHRVVSTILDLDPSEKHHETRYQPAAKQAPDANLEQLLRHEKVNGPADRDMNVTTQDMVTLRGIYVYIHDMDEKTKPVMVRDYPKATAKDVTGKWPQLRLSAPGRCPFVEDIPYTKKMQQQERDREAADLASRKTRAGTSIAPSQQLPEHEGNLRRSPRKIAQPTRTGQSNATQPPRPAPSMRQSSADLMPPLFGSTQANLRGLPRMVGGEPVASGMQHSNVTSAIRSQAISSAAISSTAPGLNRRVGDTKEVSLLKRKVFASNPSSYVNDVRAAINDDQAPPPRAAKRRAQETLGVVHEDDDADDHRPKAKSAAPKRRKTVEREAKPGYCENCRDKYEDFDDHVLTRKHRKFALSDENWKDLDALLGQLKRPHKKIR